MKERGCKNLFGPFWDSKKILGLRNFVEIFRIFSIFGPHCWRCLVKERGCKNFRAARISSGTLDLGPTWPSSFKSIGGRRRRTPAAAAGSELATYYGPLPSSRHSGETLESAKNLFRKVARRPWFLCAPGASLSCEEEMIQRDSRRRLAAAAG